MQSSVDFNGANWSQAQKVIASLKARNLATKLPYLSNKVSAYLPPLDSLPFTTTTPDGATAFSDSFAPYPAAGSGQEVILQKVVEQGKLCVVRKQAIFHQGVNPPDGSGNVVWRVLINGAAVKGMNYMLSQYGAQLLPQDCFFTAVENDVMQVTVEVPAGKTAPPGSTAARWDGYTISLNEAVST
jgi:hypothetical protein